MKTDELAKQIFKTLEAKKIKHIIQLDVKGKCDFTDIMIIGSGTSNRHIKTLTDAVVKITKALSHPPLGIEGEDYNEWVLIDLDNIVVHIMKEETREFYQLEKLWGHSIENNQANE